MKRIQKILSIALLIPILLGMGCQEDKQYNTLNDDNAPGPVSGTRVESMPGGAKIFYTLPADESLRYVRAEYEIRPGEKRESKSSNFTNYIVVDGFPNTEEREIILYAVSRGEKSSTPVTVKIKPNTPPVQEVFSTLSFRETFGGVSVSYQNQGEASMALTLLARNANGEMQEVDTYYSKLKEGRFSARGFAAEKRQFGVVVRDRWGNLSDTAFAEVTPVFEELIPKPFQAFNLPTDIYLPHAGANNSVDKIWDDRLSAAGGGVPVFHTIPGSGMPQQFTFDLKVRAKLSRFKIFGRGPGKDWVFKQGAPKRWEMWGSNSPDPTGSWDGWVKLMDCESVKPSGLPVGTNSDDDINLSMVVGEDFIFPDDAPPVRYIRFKTLETYDYLDYIYIAELTFWGRRE
jgi:hypothetical protein